jgi:alpha-beta hydrolase superfamily lysophospholipase
MREQVSHFLGAKNIKLVQDTWFPDGKIIGTLVVVHGAGEHIRRYQNLVEALVPAGFILTGYDHRGHGRSEGQRGHINSWSEYQDDLHKFMGLARDLAPGLPMFIYGHSLGSLIVLDYILHHPEGLNGAIISGTSVDPKDAAPPFLVLLAKFFSRTIPKFSLKVELEGTSLSRDKKEADGYMNDPLVHWSRSARWGTECLRIVDQIKNNAAEIRVPTLFLHGERDPLVSAAGAKQFYDQIVYPNKELIIYPNGLHEPHNDLNHEEVVCDMLDWMFHNL